MINSTKRKELDVRKLVMKNFDVNFPDETRMHELNVKFYGPQDTPYHGGIWKVHIVLPAEYPYKSPSVGFMNRIFHPNVDEMSGSVCLDVINQTWSPMFDLVNIFESFLPQLLRYPNPADPLNGEAAAILLRSPEAFHSRARECVRRYASLDFSFDSDDEEDSASATDSGVSAKTTSNSSLSSEMSYKDNNSMIIDSSFPSHTSPLIMGKQTHSLSPSTVAYSPGSLQLGFSDEKSCAPEMTNLDLGSPQDIHGSLLLSKFFSDSSPVKMGLFCDLPKPNFLLSFASESNSSLKLFDVLQEGMDVIDDGCSDVSDMSEV